MLACGVLGAVVACGDGLDPQSGVEAELRVTSEAQYHEDAFPVDQDADAGLSGLSGDAGALAPQVISFDTRGTTIRPGQSKKMKGLASSATRTLAVQIEGDRGYWSIPVDVVSAESAPNLQFAADMSFARTLKPGPLKLWFAAANAEGEYGAARFLAMKVLDTAAQGELVVVLDWNQDMDLDLVVVGPDGSLVSAEDGYVDREGSRITGEQSPEVDRDSNSDCKIDGIRSESAIYPVKPAAGAYKVFVRTGAPCGVASTSWRVQVYRGGALKGAVVGASYAAQYDTPNGGPDGLGVFATSFNVN